MNTGTVKSGVLAGVRAAIIDLDGTMLDTVPDFHVAINGMRSEFNLAPISEATIKNMVGKGSENLIRSVLALDFDATGVEQRFEQAMDAYQRHYLAINGDFSTLYPDVLQGLAAMKAAGLRLACVTNKPVAFALPLLQQKNLAGYFDIVYGGDSLPKKKPDPMPLLQVCADFDLAPAKVVAIGDSSNDAQAARAAGCPVLTVPYGYNHGHSIHDTDSDGIVNTLLEAAHFIRMQN
ncbi:MULTISPECIES: phosphoglycolate phosphatase [unclassified Janthinobacterium]|uniref:phosphoglycolate phosphatase n=1 Tax=unclassified Janthinobacterium TaxID=2610881 RepID=UPI001615945A|nr:MULTISPECIES: phosphoglycolate phosphatase [unclassified Janthinobacterium]MBB5370627.1 phosphoglycolate phosphatase [Janthinobacterium sp. K2C7]MBB5383433.1 phosphoglycolate phosphatase [Janthinobacterium sp. K2Li3]MBB5388887.1 phosphoglycolate phosphatase [Janthinobacterium sp. K2E3]